MLLRLSLIIQGTKGLSLFYLELKNDDGKLNNIQIYKLKNKLGTRQLPTAELLLHGSRAFKVRNLLTCISILINYVELNCHLYNLISKQFTIDLAFAFLLTSNETIDLINQIDFLENFYVQLFSRITVYKSS